MSSKPTYMIFSSNEKVFIHKWKVKTGQAFVSSQVLFLYGDHESTPKDLKKYRASSYGFIRKILLAEGSQIIKGSVLLEIAPCVHTTVINDMCADCGIDLRLNEQVLQTDASIPMVHTIPELKVSPKIALELGKADTNRLLQERKLVLLVDLDQTLIHTTNENVPVEQENIHHFQLYGPHSPWYHTKLRPGIENFLSKVSLLYELHICTFGARNYAHTIANLLDKDGVLFSQRILSRDECFNVNSKTDNLKSLFPCGDSMVCIIDDREDVWNMAPNLIQVKPYHFFKQTGDINAPAEVTDRKSFIDKKPLAGYTNKTVANVSQITITQSTNNSNVVDLPLGKGGTHSAEETKKEGLINEIDLHRIKNDDADDYLIYLESILETIHATFYELYDNSKEIPDLKIIIPNLRSRILGGKILVFSGLVPTNIKLEQSRAYKVAKSLGATVNQHINEETTHLVAAAAGTFKVNAARKNRNIHIVTPDWLWCCAERWECVNERLFPVDPGRPSKMRQPPPHCHSPERQSTPYETCEHTVETSKCDEQKFVDTISPLLSFSNADLAAMNQEFDMFFESNSSSEDDLVNEEDVPNKICFRKRVIETDSLQAAEADVKRKMAEEK